MINNHKYKRMDFKKLIAEVDPDIAYMLGFVAADGCISKQKYSDVLIIALHFKDAEILYKLRDILGVDNPIIFRDIKKGSRQAQLSVVQKGLAEYFGLYGIMPRKSTRVKWPENLPKKLLPHYVRGYFDGDGSATLKNTLTGYTLVGVSFTSSSKAFIVKLKNWLISKKLKIKLKSRRLDSGNYSYDVVLVKPARQFLKIYNLLYDFRHMVYLNRKYKQFMICYNNPSLLTKYTIEATNKVYDNVEECASDLGISSATVFRHLKGTFPNVYKLKRCYIPFYAEMLEK